MAPIKRLLISAPYMFYYLSIINVYSMRVNDNKSCRKKHLWVISLTITSLFPPLVIVVYYWAIARKTTLSFCIPGLQENSSILLLRLFLDWESVFVDILVGFPDAASAFISQSLLREVSETGCSKLEVFVLWLLSISIEGSAKTSFGYNNNLFET